MSSLKFLSWKLKQLYASWGLLPYPGKPQSCQRRFEFRNKTVITRGNWTFRYQLVALQHFLGIYSKQWQWNKLPLHTCSATAVQHEVFFFHIYRVARLYRTPVIRYWKRSRYEWVLHHYFFSTVGWLHPIIARHRCAREDELELVKCTKKIEGNLPSFNVWKCVGKTQREWRILGTHFLKKK